MNHWPFGEGDDDAATPKPYVEYGVMGQYEAIADALGRTVTYDTLQPFLQENAVSQLGGEEGCDVIISNASEHSTAAVNSLLRSGRQVGMITEGDTKATLSAPMKTGSLCLMITSSQAPA